MTDPTSQTNEPLFSFSISEDFSMSVELGAWVAPAVLALAAGGLIWLWFRGRIGLGSFELDSAGIGIGDTNVSFKPNRTDRQIAYAIWVELSTRKVGLAIDPEHDVISEVYDSWYSFFGVTRDLIKEVPAHKLKSKGTRAIVRASVQVLNEGLRPHLTQWQARYRRWYEATLKDDDIRDPQSVQQEFPKYDDLVKDLLEINAKLIEYRKAMYQLATGDPESIIAIDEEIMD
ncbi:hypothetical protein [Yoonia sp. R2-816]|uniref:hypothetical protein n=1 Tax=Yoonia sp. R2-816 TaxID=3342638 RepID=UPI0037284525